MADESMTQLIDEFEKAKFTSKPAEKMRKKISKVLVLNELEQEKAKGIRHNLKAIFSFINSGSPSIPTFDGKEDFKETISKMGILEKIVALPVCVLLLPVVAVKMGINTGILAKWLLEKPELVDKLKQEGLYDNIMEYAKDDKDKFAKLNEQDYMNHLKGTEDYKYNDLMQEMSDEISEKGREA